MLDATLTCGRWRHIFKLCLELFDIFIDYVELLLEIRFWRKKVNVNGLTRRAVHDWKTNIRGIPYSQMLLLLPALLCTLPAHGTNLSSCSSCSRPTGCSLFLTFQFWGGGRHIKQRKIKIGHFMTTCRLTVFCSFLPPSGRVTYFSLPFCLSSPSPLNTGDAARHVVTYQKWAFN